MNILEASRPFDYNHVVFVAGRAGFCEIRRFDCDELGAAVAVRAFSFVLIAGLEMVFVDLDGVRVCSFRHRWGCGKGKCLIPVTLEAFHVAELSLRVRTSLEGFAASVVEVSDLFRGFRSRNGRRLYRGRWLTLGPR